MVKKRAIRRRASSLHWTVWLLFITCLDTRNVNSDVLDVYSDCVNLIFLGCNGGDDLSARGSLT